MNRLTQNKNHDWLISYLRHQKKFDADLIEKMLIKLGEYENTGLEPAKTTALQKDYKIAKTCMCEFCHKRSKEQNVLCGCAACKYGGKSNG